MSVTRSTALQRPACVSVVTAMTVFKKTRWVHHRSIRWQKIFFLKGWNLTGTSNQAKELINLLKNQGRPTLDRTLHGLRQPPSLPPCRGDFLLSPSQSCTPTLGLQFITCLLRRCGRGVPHGRTASDEFTSRFSRYSFGRTPGFMWTLRDVGLLARHILPSQLEIPSFQVYPHPGHLRKVWTGDVLFPRN
jgi:hypothetical protein